MNIFEAIFFILAILFCVFNIWFFKRVRSIKVDKQEQLKEKEQIEKQVQQLKIQKASIEASYSVIGQQLEKAEKIIKQKKEQIGYINNSILQRKQQIKEVLDKSYQEQVDKTNKKLEQYKKVTHNAANLYIDSLQKNYENAEAAYKTKMTQIKEEHDEAAAALQSLKDTRKAAYDAILKQKQVKQNKNNYRLLPSSIESEDIHTLQHIKSNLHKPRILSMLIWQTYWQPLAKEKFPIILQAKTKTGIYKITNIQTDESYIGQSLDIYTRWCSHCKAGLGIDTPAGNKLYKSIQEYGLQNFTFELLCQCSKEQLNEKERYFIQLYQADVYGFNGTVGNK